VGDLEAARKARDPKILPKHWVMMAASGIAIEGGTVLLLRDLHGFWAGIGGFIEAGETPDEAIVREVREELGVDSTVVQHYRPFIAWNVAQLDDPVSFLLFPHRIKLSSLDLRPDPTEVTDLAWAAPEKLGEYEMLPHVKALFQARLPEWLAG